VTRNPRNRLPLRIARAERNTEVMHLEWEFEEAKRRIWARPVDYERLLGRATIEPRRALELARRGWKRLDAFLRHPIVAGIIVGLALLGIGLWLGLP
jgi:hypothetical protein